MATDWRRRDLRWRASPPDGSKDYPGILAGYEHLSVKSAPRVVVIFWW